MADDIKFDSTEYKSTGNSYYKATDAYANNKETFISFYHVPSEKSVYFKAFITSFNESFSSDWTSEQVFGRADPIQTFKQNQRNISLNFKVPAAHEGEAYTNLARVQKLIQFLYPTYTDAAQANTITQSPLVRMKVMNLLRQAPIAAETGAPANGIYNDYNSGGSGADSGLLGVITNLTVNHNLEGDDGVIEKGQNTVLPKLLDVSVSFTVIHEHTVGWNESDGFDGNRLFPYGVQLFDAEVQSAALESAAQAVAPTEIDSNAGGMDGTAASADTAADALAWTEGWADYTYNSNGSITYTVREDGREVTVTPESEYYSGIMGKADWK